VGERLRLGLLIVVGTLFRLLVLLAVAAIAVLDALFLFPQSHAKGKLLDGLLLLACVVLAVLILIPVFAPDFRWRRRSRVAGSAQARRGSQVKTSRR
jgi:hypothetical protein